MRPAPDIESKWNLLRFEVNAILADTWDSRKYFAYRAIWARRTKPTPSKKKNWGQWWRDFYGNGEQTIEDYHEERRRETHANQDA